MQGSRVNKKNSRIFRVIASFLCGECVILTQNRNEVFYEITTGRYQNRKF